MCCGRNVACFTKRRAGGGPLLRVSRIPDWVNEHVLAHFLIGIRYFGAFLAMAVAMEAADWLPFWRSLRWEFVVGCLERNKELGLGDVVDRSLDEEVDLIAICAL